MLMSQPAISDSDVRCPRFGVCRPDSSDPCAKATLDASTSAAIVTVRTLAPSHPRTLAPSYRRTRAPSHLCVVLRIDMLHLTARFDAPARGSVVVLARERPRIGHGLTGLSTLRDELGACGLDVAGLIPRTALQHRGPSVPPPRDPESRECFRMYRFL